MQFVKLKRWGKRHLVVDGKRMTYCGKRWTGLTRVFNIRRKDQRSVCVQCRKRAYGRHPFPEELRAA